MCIEWNKNESQSFDLNRMICFYFIIIIIFSFFNFFLFSSYHFLFLRFVFELVFSIRITKTSIFNRDVWMFDGAEIVFITYLSHTKQRNIKYWFSSWAIAIQKVNFPDFNKSKISICYFEKWFDTFLTNSKWMRPEKWNRPNQQHFRINLIISRIFIGFSHQFIQF